MFAYQNETFLYYPPTCLFALFEIGDQLDKYLSSKGMISKVYIVHSVTPLETLACFPSDVSLVNSWYSAALFISTTTFSMYWYIHYAIWIYICLHDFILKKCPLYAA